VIRAWPAALIALVLSACSHSGTDGGEPVPVPRPRTDTSGACEGPCDASAPSIPETDDTSGFGDVTTYGDVAHPQPSAGGACNYGATGITAFAAIQVSRQPGDLLGQWRGGRACGQCAEVRARTPSGWKTTVARIVDKCPDAYCGIDLGGAPARDLMGERPGRYSGAWRFVPCDGHAGVSDGPPVLFVKDGANAYWSLVQVRNPSERILGMRMRKAGTLPWTDLAWAAEAENFYHIPAGILQDAGEYELEAILPHGEPYGLRLKGSDLAVAETTFALGRSATGKK
jgi:expansin (peptidoglycan-binding protein)